MQIIMPDEKERIMMETIKSIIFFLILSTLVCQLIDGTKYKPYVNLVIGFMLLSLMIQPILSMTGNDQVLQEAFAKVSNHTETISFQDKAREVKEEQMRKEIQTTLEKNKMKVRNIGLKIDETGTIASVDIEVQDVKKQEKQIKTILSRFYNVQSSNINISNGKCKKMM